MDLPFGYCTQIMLSMKRRFKRLPDCIICLISFIFIPAAIILHFMAGMQTVWPISPGVHEMNKYRCCSQGLVFPRSIIPSFIERTDPTTDWLVDMMVEKIEPRTLDTLGSGSIITAAYWSYKLKRIWL